MLSVKLLNHNAGSQKHKSFGMELLKAPGSMYGVPKFS